MTVKDPVSAFVLETADTQIDLDGLNAPALTINHIASGKHVTFNSKMKIRSFKDEFNADILIIFVLQAKTCQKIADEAREFYIQLPCQDTFAIGNS
mgnify:CR=1 FL=1